MEKERELPRQRPILRYVEFRAALPKTATERVEKYKLKQEGIGQAWDREAAGYKLARD
jgi:crotonobetaine/carnitine-CoA ligase